jgi:hypothetical protein
MAKNVFVSGEEALLVSDGESDDCADVKVSDQLLASTDAKYLLTYLPIVGDVWFDCGDGAVACCASFSTLRGVSLNEAFLLCDFDLLARCFEKLPS